jgi:hypothetical protein
VNLVLRSICLGSPRLAPSGKMCDSKSDKNALRTTQKQIASLCVESHLRTQSELCNDRPELETGNGRRTTDHANLDKHSRHLKGEQSLRDSTGTSPTYGAFANFYGFDRAVSM